MELCIFNKIEDDLCIKGILEKDNVIVLRNIIEFSETEGVTSSAIKEYVATRLANDDNIYHVLHRRVNLSEMTFTDLQNLILSRFIKSCFQLKLSTHRQVILSDSVTDMWHQLER